MSRIRVLILATHPVQYAVPVYRKYETLGLIELDVAFLSENGLGEGGFDSGYSREINWDVDLNSGYRHERLKNLGRETYPRFLQFVNPSVVSLIRRRRYDLVVCAAGYWHATSWLSLLGAKLGGAKWTFVTDAVELEGPRRLGRLQVALKRAFLRFLMLVSDGAFVASDASGRYMRQFSVRTPIARFAYVADPTRFQPGDSRMSSEELRATYVGRLVPHKRVGDLVEALALVEGWSLTIAGDGPERDALIRLANRLGVADRVTFAGFVNQSELPNLFARTDVLLLPSEFEPFGMVVHEAGLCGVPAIVSSRCVGVIGELVDDYESGLIFQMGRPGELAKCVATLIGDPSLLDTLRSGITARSTARTIDAQATEFAAGAQSIVSS